MGNHPIQMGLRIALELAALAGAARFGWLKSSQLELSIGLHWLSAIALPVIFMVLWGCFAVPGDPSRSGSAPVPVPGLVRLVLELSLFFATSFALHHVGHSRLAATLAGFTLLHYGFAWDRIQWLSQR